MPSSKGVNVGVSWFYRAAHVFARCSRRRQVDVKAKRAFPGNPKMLINVDVS
jgi:hypothetical protein